MVVIVEEDLCGFADDMAAEDWVAAGVYGVWDDGRGATSVESERPVGEVEVTLAVYFVALWRRVEVTTVVGKWWSFMMLDNTMI